MAAVYDRRIIYIDPASRPKLNATVADRRHRKPKRVEVRAALPQKSTEIFLFPAPRARITVKLPFPPIELLGVHSPPATG